MCMGKGKGIWNNSEMKTYLSDSAFTSYQNKSLDVFPQNLELWPHWLHWHIKGLLQVYCVAFSDVFHLTHLLFPHYISGSFLVLNGGEKTLAITPSSHFVTTASLRRAIYLIPGAQVFLV